MDEFGTFSWGSLGYVWQMKEGSSYFPGFCPEQLSVHCSIHGHMKSIDELEGALVEAWRKHNHMEIFKWNSKSKKGGNWIYHAGTSKKKARIALLRSSKILEQGL